MRVLRKCRRVVCMIFWTLFSALRALPSILKREKWSGVSSMTGEVGRWCRGILSICNIRLVVHGDAAQGAGALIVSNHTGYVDIPVHASVFPIRFAPKAELKDTPVFGWLARLSRPVWVDRKSRMGSGKCAAEFAATLEHGISLLVYPEGTTSDGTKLLPFKTGPFEPAVKEDRSVLPVLTFYSVPEGEEHPGWFDDSEMTAHIRRFLGISEIRADLYILPPVSPGGMDRKTFSLHVRSLMEEAKERIMEERKQEKIFP
ncbi:MAG: 1-acyl-sn-glycerol-3-phosphate acyltransferase [Lentisphaeria bacterium]|nr:1-acyl-sn-glycerol-3-phosphate acyltransferase [Lentisphaeria bacterium]